MAFSFRERQMGLKDIEKKHYDLVIVGGGINGAGVAREAAGRGLKVALLEAKDFSIGTSSRSSKLIHGGIRYLENLEFKLVFEALSERATLFDMAPHLVHPLRFVLPVYKEARVGYFKMGLGMLLYDILAAFEMPELHARLNAKETVARIPGIDPKDLVGSFEYSDAYMDDDRLVHETLRGADDWGADIFNFCKVTDAQWDSDRITSLTFKDELSGTPYQVSGDQFLGAVGPWTDIFGQEVAQAASKKWANKMRPTKGVHLTFPRHRLPIEKAVVMAIGERIIFVIPRHEMVIVGTTDTDFKGDPYDVAVSADDVDYILKALDQYFPEFHIQSQDIIASYSGVRPLVEDGSATEGKTSREHQIFSFGENLTFIGGGKYTTYRKIADDVVHAVFDKMSFDQRMSFGVSRSKEPINPKVTPASYERLKHSVEALAEDYGEPVKTVRALVERHGEEAFDILNLMKTVDCKSEFPDGELRRWYAEAVFAIRTTCCLRIEDFYWRRSPLFLSYPDHGVSFLDGIAVAFQRELGWSDAEKESDIQNFRNAMEKELAWQSQGQ